MSQLNVGLVGWRGMVGSVLMQRMQEEKDFDQINPVFFTTSQKGKPAPDFAGKDCGTLEDAFDIDALKAFANDVDVITFEFENIPTAALDALESLRPIRPNRTALATSQDRITEKDFLTSLGLKTAPYRAVDTLDDLTQAVTDIGTPSILKTRRFGYDGKGQKVYASPVDIAEAQSDLESIGHGP